MPGGGSSVGYARLRTAREDPLDQASVLHRAGCREVFSDVASSVLDRRPARDRALAALGEGDELLVVRMDRLGSSSEDLCAVAARIRASGAHLRSLQDKIDSATAYGALFLDLMVTLDSMARILREEAAPARQPGQTRNGRPPVLNADDVELAAQLYYEERETVGQIAQRLGVSRATIYRYLSRRAASEG